MADIITLSSSDEEPNLPPKKRIKPTPVSNLPHITITKVPKEKTKKTEIVSLCSDDDINVVPDDIEITPVNGKKKKKHKKKKHTYKEKNNTSESVIISEDEVESDSSTVEFNSNHDDIQTNESTSENIQSETASIQCDDAKNDKSETDIIDVSIESGETEPEVADDEDKQLVKDLEDSYVLNEDNESEKVDNNSSEDVALVSDEPEPCSSTTSTKFPNTILLDTFLSTVKEKIKDTKYATIQDKFSTLRTFYKTCIEELGSSNNFTRTLTESTAKATKSSMQSVICFNDIYQQLKETVSTGCIDVDRHELIKLKKLEKTIKKLTVIIKKLEVTEIDFDLEEDSSYLQLERYLARLDKVYKKYCELMKKNPYCGRLTHSKLVFLDSKYNEINRAIIKTYKNNKKFPSYYEIEQLITKVVKDSKLDLNEAKIKSESKHCFQKLGELLQKRRRRELYESHYIHLEETNDPANDHTDLSSLLKNNYIEGQKKIDKLVEEYVTKQDNKEDSVEEEQEEEEEEEDEEKDVSEKSSSDDSESVEEVCEQSENT